MIKFFKITIILQLSIVLTYAQQSADAPIVVCEGGNISEEIDASFQVPKGLRLGPQTSFIEVTYKDFTPEAKKAFQAAIEVWQSILVSRTPIKINAVWESIPSTTLASSGAGKVFKNFGSGIKDVWYPVALAEAISGRNLNEDGADINININKNTAWSFDINGAKITGKYDLKTVVLHEIAHGLGFTTSMKIGSNEAQGTYGLSGLPFIYDIFIQNANKVLLTNGKVIGNPSVELKSFYTGGNIFFKIDNKKYSANLPKIYAPTVFRPGGSISHIDEFAFPKGSANAMMSPQFATAEINHFPGPLIMAMLNQMGWSLNFFDGSVITSLPAEENTSKLFVYPNPSSDFLNLILPDKFQNKLLIIKVFDKRGSQVFADIKMPSAVTSNQLDVRNLAQGSYILHLENSEGQVATNFIKL